MYQAKGLLDGTVHEYITRHAIMINNMFDCGLELN